MSRKLVILGIAMLSSNALADVSVTTVDFLPAAGVAVNAAGPLLVRMDEARNRLIVANTLSSSLSIIDCGTNTVENVALDGRALQHLKSEAMTVNRRTGDLYLIGTNCLYIVSPATKSSRSVRTDVQFESIAVDEETGNVFVAGRESPTLGFLEASSKKPKFRKWLDYREELINLNATPPPPIRKVIADNLLKRVIAVDGFTSTVFQFDGKSGKPLSSRPVALARGGRWHLAGYNETSHCLYIVTETDERKVVEAARIDILDGDDIVVELPGFTEGVGITYNPAREEIYIPYDNHASVHVVDFGGAATVDEIKIPAYGNDASAVDTATSILYVASWAFGEVDVIDLQRRMLLKRITGLGIIPHMFSFAFNPNGNRIYFPKGATAVNGTFGAALSVLDPVSGKTEKVYTGWAPVDLIELASRKGFIVFNSEDQFAEVHPDGSYEMHALPFDYPIEAVRGPEEDIYLSYGPHQSYWPTVYIWGAKNGILTIDGKYFSFYDRRIPRQAQQMVLDRNGALYFTQNNWGREEQFLGVLGDQIRLFDANKRIPLGEEVERETTQRILRYDRQMHRLYLVRIGERDDDPSVLQVIDPDSNKVIRSMMLGVTSTDLVFDDENIYVSNFDSRSVTIIDKTDFTVREIPAGGGPLRLCRTEEQVYVVNNLDNTLQEVLGPGRTHRIPHAGMPDNVFPWDNGVVVASHSHGELHIVRFDPHTERFSLLHREEYPFGDTSFDSRNTSFYVRGQFGDAVFEITRGKTDSDGRLWITDFLAGKLFIVSRN